MSHLAPMSHSPSPSALPSAEETELRAGLAGLLQRAGRTVAAVPDLRSAGSDQLFAAARLVGTCGQLLSEAAGLNSRLRDLEGLTTDGELGSASAAFAISAVAGELTKLRAELAERGTGV